MTEERCSACGRTCQVEELLLREDNGQPVCADCSGLLADEDLSCRYDEW